VNALDLDVVQRGWVNPHTHTLANKRRQTLLVGVFGAPEGTQEAGDVDRGTQAFELVEVTPPARSSAEPESEQLVPASKSVSTAATAAQRVRALRCWRGRLERDR
jgi:hypothetical protein